MERLPEERVKRLGEVVGIAAALVATIALHAVMFGGDGYFPLRFLLTPFGDPVAFAFFAAAVVVLVVKAVRARHDRDWSALFRPASVDRTEELAADPVDRYLGRPSRRPVPTSPEGGITRRALASAAYTTLAQTLFMWVFPVAILPVAVVIYVIALALTLSFLLVMKTRPDRSALRTR